MSAQNIFGLDIGSFSTKMVQLTPGNNPSLVAAGSIPTPVKALFSESDQDIEELADALKKLHQEVRISTPYVAAALPESQIFTRVVEMPPLTDAEVASAIKWEAEQYVPVPLSEVRLDWQILSRPLTEDKNSKMEVLLVAAPIVLIDKYLKVFKLAEFKPVALETETTAVVRSLVNEEQTPLTTMVVSIGATTTDICISHEGNLTFTRSIATGGTAFTRAIAQDLGFETDQAEEYKKTYGLDANQLEGKVMQSIKPVFDVAVNEIRRALAYYSNKKPDDSVKRIILCGGTAKLPGLVVYLANALGIEVQIGNPWEKINVPEKIKDKLNEEGSSYSVSVGLAMRNI
ncbi:MAG: pilus assembly protein PilM [Patescibacteria group bacterium]|nr:pilus assembly protein PilM [Patescibacteria group bacterium]